MAARKEDALKEFAQTQQQAQQKQSFGRMLLLLAAIAFGAIIVIGLAASLIGGAGFGAEKCVGRVQVRGEITYEGSGGFFEGSPPAEQIVQEIGNADADNRVGAILLDVDSPGGTPVASKEIFDAVKRAEKPVVAYFGETAASGGYYVGSAADYIVANPNTITGSIGARLTLFNYAGLFEKLGLREESVQSGELKDIGAGYRNATEKERELLGRLINESAENFVSDVREAREGRLTNYFEELLDARVVGAKDAKAAGLVDEIGGFRQAKLKAARLAGMNASDENLDSIEFCEFKPRRSFWDALAGMSSDLGASFAKGLKAELRKQEMGLEYR